MIQTAKAAARAADTEQDAALREFLQGLSARAHRRDSCNPYRLPGRLHNLQVYLDAMLHRPGRRVLLVGEAPGYRGCLLTGIPFTSPRLLDRAPHPFLRRLRPRLQLGGDSGEATATCVWRGLARRRRLPLFWNAFPFHPHPAGRPLGNRPPNARELQEGQRYLRRLAHLYRPELVVGVGRRGFEAACRALPDLPLLRIRHPSHGGQQAFLDGLEQVYGGRPLSARRD